MSTTSEIRALEDRRNQAAIDVDLSLLDELLADELVFNHSSTAVDSKESYLAGLKAGKWVYKRVERRAESVDLFGDMARITGEVRLTLLNPDGSDRVTESRFLAIWCRRASGWQFIAWQSTRLPAASETP